MCVCVCVCIHTYIYIDINVYKHTYMHIHIQYICVYIYVHLYVHPSVPTRGCTYHAAARAGAPPGPKAAHTRSNVVTDAVFHAPMFALNADAEESACAPSPPRSTPTRRRSHVSARIACAPDRTRTRAHARTRGARVHAHTYLSQQYMYKITIYEYNII